MADNKYSGRGSIYYLTGTGRNKRVLHVSKVYLNELQYRDPNPTFSNGMVSEYNCANFERELENKAYIHDNVLYKHPTLPLGEFANRNEYNRIRNCEEVRNRR